MNLYYIDSGVDKYFSKKTDAEKAAQEIADKTQRPVMVSRMYIAIDRDNITRMANQERGFTKFVGRVCVIEPRKRPKLKLRKIAAVTALFVVLLPNLADAANCTTRRSGSVTITTCHSKSNPYSECRSYKSGSVVKTHCR